MTAGAEEPGAPRRRAGWRQVVVTMIWALFMIGKRGTWERDGAIVSFAQVLVGAVVTGLVVILALAGLVAIALS